MAVSKVVKSNGDVIMDISQDNVNPNNLLQGGTAHGSDGEAVQGAVIVAPTDVTEVSDTTPYLYKTSEHDAVYDELVGGSVAWNQLVQNGNFESTSGWATSGGTMTTLSTANNILTISSTASINTSDVRLQQTINFVDSHKYLFTVTGYSSAAHNHQRDGGIEIYPMNTSVITIVFSTTKQTYYKVFNTAAGSTIVSQIRLYSMDSITSHISNLFCVDLTQMFGSTIADYVYNLEQSTAGSGIAWLKTYGFFTEDYYAYNAGTLMSVNVRGKKVVGKNLLKLTTSTQTTYGVTYISDSETGIVTATGTSTAGSGGAQFSIPIPAELAGNYYFSALTSTGADSTYDAYVWCNTDNARAKKWNGTTNSSSDYGNGNVEIRLEAEKTYVLNLRVKNGVTVNNLVFKPMIRRADITDSTFEPYTSLTYPIQSTDLRGLYKLNGNKLYTDGDIYSADGTVTRKYGIVDLGMQDWGFNNVSGHQYFWTDGIASTIKKVASLNDKSNSVCGNYIIESYASVYANSTDKIIGVSTSGRIAIYDSSKSSMTTTQFKTAMSGVYLIYELATPTTVTASSYTAPQMVYRSGTEEYLDARDVPMPVGGNRKYIDIPEWMVNEYFDDVRAETSTLKTISKLQQENEVLRNALSQSTFFIPEGTTTVTSATITDKTKYFYYMPNSVISIGNYAFEVCENLTSITIPNGVTSIGNSAFYACTSLKSITIPNSVANIGDNAFDNCISLTSITIPNGVTSIGDYAFKSCTSLVSITILNGVTSIGDSAFYYCESLRSITIPNSVTNIGDYAFEDCTNLISITVNKPQGSISGAPWGAPNATVTWTG